MTRMLAVLCLLLASLSPAFAGLADTPLPVLQTGATTLHLYSIPGVINDGVGTYVSCTSVAPTTIKVGVEAFKPDGTLADGESLSVAPGATVTFGTAGAFGVHVDQILATGTLLNGSARVLATSKSLLCTAFIADKANDPPTSMVSLTIVAKLKQKAAN